VRGSARSAMATMSVRNRSRSSSQRT
jgi:hypothetical protein